jgi:hypothetical protein
LTAAETPKRVVVYGVSLLNNSLGPTMPELTCIMDISWAFHASFILCDAPNTVTAVSALQSTPHHFLERCDKVGIPEDAQAKFAWEGVEARV